jgi:polysaccharide deacetylase family protein (PEP-CTERM system associated)
VPYEYTELPPLPAASGRPIVNAMTIDIEDYFQVSAFAPMVSPDAWGTFESRVAANTDRLLAAFAAAKVRATFFVLGWVAEQHPALIRRIAEAGHELASHSHWHGLVYDLTPESFRADLRRARHAIEDASGVTVRGFRAPSFSITERSLWALDVLIEEGHTYDASVFPVRHDRYGIPSAPRHAHRVHRGAGSIVELPGSTAMVGPARVPVGGGYFRLLPYAVTRWAVRQLNDAAQPAMFYLHPWEIDPLQPRLEAPLLSRLRHYNQLAATEHRLLQLLADFRWGAIEDIWPVTASAGTARSPQPSSSAPPLVDAR